MKTRDNIIRKTFNKKGFTLVELLAVIVILAIIMVLAIPSVLTVMETARKKTFAEYTTKVYNASNQKYSTDLLTESDQPSCVIYNIVNDLDLSNVGSFKGYVAVSEDNDSVKFYITLYDETYMLVAYNYSDKINSKFEKVEIDDSVLDYNADEKDTLLTVEYLASVANKDCVYENIMVNAGDAIRKDISTLKTGKEVNLLWKKLVNEAAESHSTVDNNIQNIVKVDSPPVEGTTTVVISDGNDKQEETISWYQDNTIYVYTKANHIYANNNSDSLFASMNELVGVDLSLFDFSKSESLSFLLYGDVKITTIDLTKINTSKAKKLDGFIANCTNLTNIIGIEDFDVSNCQDLSGFFQLLTNITSLDLSKWDVSNVKKLYALFTGCVNLTNLNISNWNTSSVYDMTGVFYNCQNLTSIDLSKWDVSNVKIFDYLFCNCVRLTNIDMTGWDTSGALTMSFMFHNCNELEYVDVSHFNTSNVIYLDHMFNVSEDTPVSNKQGKLKSLDVSKWDVSKVEHLDWFLEDQKYITTLDLSNWDTSNCKTFKGVFGGMRKLKTIYVSEKFVISPDAESKDDLFWLCTSLVGGNGTKYASDNTHIGYKYAVIDTPETPGYFTKKE